MVIDQLKSAVSRSGTREFALIRRSGQPDDPSKIKSYDRRKSPHEVEIEEDLPVGKYYLQEIKSNGDFGDQLWSETLFGSESDLEEVKRAAERAEERAERAEQQAEESGGGRPAQSGGFDDPDDALRYEIRRGIIENPKLMQRYGDRIVDWAFSGGEPEISYDIENEWQATLYELRNNPGKVEEFVELGETLTRRLGRAASEGVTEGLEGEGYGEIEAGSSTSDDRDDQGRDRDLDGGAVDMSDLAGAEEQDELEDEGGEMALDLPEFDPQAGDDEPEAEAEPKAADGGEGSEEDSEPVDPEEIADDLDAEPEVESSS